MSAIYSRLPDDLRMRVADTGNSRANVCCDKKYSFGGDTIGIE